jgi:hypothetical protein
MTDNYLYYSENLDILRRYIKAESVDLIYLEPPFNSIATYDVLFGEQNPFQFELWVLGLVGARPTEREQGADKGIDGHL